VLQTSQVQWRLEPLPGAGLQREIFQAPGKPSLLPEAGAGQQGTDQRPSDGACLGELHCRLQQTDERRLRPEHLLHHLQGGRERGLAGGEETRLCRRYWENCDSVDRGFEEL